MRIAFDTSLYHFTQAGVTQYTKALIRALRATEECEVHEVSFRPWFSRRSRALRSMDTLRHGALWRARGLDAAAAAVQADVVHSPIGNSASSRLPTVATLHDLHLWHAAGDFRLWHRISDRGYTLKTLRCAKAVVADSEFVRQDILTTFPFLEETRVHTVPCGIDAESYRYSPSRSTDVRRAQGIEGPYLLAVSTLAPNKNIHRLLEAFAEAAAELPHQLAIVGASGWKVGGLADTVSRLGLEARVVFCGRVSHEEIVTLYGEADAFLFPSLYEGFGLPPLEAMANGVPVLTSNVTSIPEVVGDAALQVNPLDVGAMTRGIVRIATDASLRAQLAKAGPERVRLFSLENLAQGMLRVYRNVLGDST